MKVHAFPAFLIAALMAAIGLSGCLGPGSDDGLEGGFDNEDRTAHVETIQEEPQWVNETVVLRMSAYPDEVPIGIGDRNCLNLVPEGKSSLLSFSAKMTWSTVFDPTFTPQLLVIGDLGDYRHSSDPGPSPREASDDQLDFDNQAPIHFIVDRSVDDQAPLQQVEMEVSVEYTGPGTFSVTTGWCSFI